MLLLLYAASVSVLLYYIWTSGPSVTLLCGLVVPVLLYEGMDGGSGIHYYKSLKDLPIIHLIKIFAYSLKSTPLFIKKNIFLCFMDSLIAHMHRTFIKSIGCVTGAEKHQLTSMTSNRSHLFKRLMVLLMLQFTREMRYVSKKSLAKNVTHLMFDTEQDCNSFV